ncbi:MAG: single-stranded-DNA-specific exonuclease RecJ [Halanaerobiaceae bacterium]
MNIEATYDSNIYIPDWMEQELDGNMLLARILLQRGFDNPEKMKKFLDPEYYQPTTPSAFPNMEKTVDLILNAVSEKKKICIYGDYDVDGVTSTVILMDMIKRIGGEAVYHLPDRFIEGYGMNKNVIKGMAGEVDIVITCDCGISNFDEVALAGELGMEVIVTDHHHLPDKLPPADVILSPKLLDEGHPAFNIPGAGMAYFLTSAVLARLNRSEESRDFLDLLSLAIVADVVPLLEENRYLLQIGLPLLAETERMGLKALFKTVGINDPTKITEEDIAFRIAPMINSAGRILKADLAAELLLTEDRFQAQKYAAELEAVNKRRKKLQDEVIDEALEILGINYGRNPIVLYRPHWNEGVIGIAAGRLSEDFQVPVILMCQKEDGKTVTGSARSIPGIHIYQELKKCEKHLSKFGGHAGAAGFSLLRDNLTAFKKTISKFLSDQLVSRDDSKVIEVDGELSMDKIDMQDYYDLRILAPFGEKNPRPLFISRDVEVIYNRATSNERHLRLILGQNGCQHSAIWWWSGDKQLRKKINVIYSLDINEFRGKKELQLVVEDILGEKNQVNEDKTASYEIDFKLLDYRDWKENKSVVPDFDDAVYYYEGLEKQESTEWLKNKELINRYQVVRRETLILLSCPPSLEIFKELIYANRPSILVLAYSRSDIIDGNTFMKQLMGLIKFIIKHRNGQLDVYKIASLTGQMESTITAGLRYLEARGYITLNNFNPRFFVVRENKEPQKTNWKMKEKELMALIKETNSFMLYFLRIEIGKLANLNELKL